jgi:hypothetical protein
MFSIFIWIIGSQQGTQVKDTNVLKNVYQKFCRIMRLYNFIMLNYIYSEWQKYGINSLKNKQIFFQKNLWIGQF